MALQRRQRHIWGFTKWLFAIKLRANSWRQNAALGRSILQPRFHYNWFRSLSQDHSKLLITIVKRLEWDTPMHCTANANSEFCILFELISFSICRSLGSRSLLRSAIYFHSRTSQPSSIFHWVSGSTDSQTQFQNKQARAHTLQVSQKKLQAY